MITVKVNQKEHLIPEDLTVQKFVEALKIQPNGIAIAINYNVVKKTDWDTKCVINNDDILIIKSTQGG